MLSEKEKQSNKAKEEVAKACIKDILFCGDDGIYETEVLGEESTTIIKHNEDYSKWIVRKLGNALKYNYYIFSNVEEVKERVRDIFILGCNEIYYDDKAEFEYAKILKYIDISLSTIGEYFEDLIEEGSTYLDCSLDVKILAIKIKRVVDYILKSLLCMDGVPPLFNKKDYLKYIAKLRKYYIDYDVEVLGEPEEYVAKKYDNWDNKEKLVNIGISMEFTEDKIKWLLNFFDNEASYKSQEEFICGKDFIISVLLRAGVLDLKRYYNTYIAEDEQLISKIFTNPNISKNYDVYSYEGKNYYVYVYSYNGATYHVSVSEVL